MNFGAYLHHDQAFIGFFQRFLVKLSVVMNLVQFNGPARGWLVLDWSNWAGVFFPRINKRVVLAQYSLFSQRMIKDHQIWSTLFLKCRNSISPLNQSCVRKKKKKNLQRLALHTNKTLSRTYSVNCRIILFLQRGKQNWKWSRSAEEMMESAPFPFPSRLSRLC